MTSLLSLFFIAGSLMIPDMSDTSAIPDSAISRGADTLAPLDSASPPDSDASIYLNPAPPDSHWITVHWVILNARDGQFLGRQKLLMDGDTIHTDTNGLLETRHPRHAGTLRVQLVHDSLTLQRDTFSLSPDKEFAQFTLEAIPRQAGKTANPPSDMVVIARREPLHERKEISKIEVSRAEMRTVAATQNDPLQVVRTLPGVTNQNDANTRPFVRGGDWYETRVFWNGVPVLQPFHALSLYSVFNMETIESMQFYSGGFPVENSNSLSGAILLKSRPVSLDTFAAWTSISMLKGHFWAGGPVIRERLSISLAYQAFWYDWLIKRSADMLTWISDDRDFERAVREYKQYVELPNFKDLELHWNLSITPTMRLDYTWLYARDIFRVLEPHYPGEHPDSGSQRNNPLRQISILDTLAFVDIPNHIHGLNLRWTINNRWDLLATLAYQSQVWSVNFPDLADNFYYKYTRDNWHARALNLYRFNDNHLFNFGLMAERDNTQYHVNLPRIAYEILTQSNLDLMENIAFIAPEGLVITDSSYISSVSQLIETIWMSYRGRISRDQWGSWFSDQWTLNANNRLNLGMRLDYENAAQTLSLSPRMSWFHRLNPRQELTLGIGAYTQDNFEFYYRHLNASLMPEKAAHINAEWSADITADYRIEISTYAKRYWDLAAGHLVPTGTIQAYMAEEALQRLYGMTYDEITARIREFDSSGAYTVSNLRALVSAAQWDSVLLHYGNKRLIFDNRGIGWAAGSEIKLNYDPTRVWRGWLSLEASLSKRKDRSDGVWYNFRRHRPWAIKWHNYFDMPGDWEMSLRLEHSAGLVYTGYTNLDRSYLNLGFQDQNASSDTLFIIERKNNRRYTPYTRFDIRLERNWSLFGHPAKTFMEIWNAFNTPNFLLLDSESGALKNVDLNYPFPIFFLGWEFRW